MDARAREETRTILGAARSGGSGRADVEERLRACIHPNEIATDEQRAAFERAVDAQLASEADGEALPSGVAALRIGDYSVTMAGRAGPDGSGGLCSAAWAILFNAGLLRREWPVAKRL